MLVLGIESSCDDTAAALLEDGRILASIVSSQDEVHAPFGGVVPELASRRHLENVLPVLQTALDRAERSLDDVDAIAVTHGPGLIGSLLVGLSMAEGLALARGLPIVGVNHLEGHLLAIHLETPVAYPYVALVVSGGHTSLYVVEAVGSYRTLGRTFDDAAGEAFDKGGKMLGLGFPAGREIDLLAREGNPSALRFPRAKVEKHHFSFSGLKTSLREYLAGRSTHVPAGGPIWDPADGLPSGAALADVAASFQEAVVDVLVEATIGAATELGIERVVVSGGVSANSRLRARMAEAAAAQNFECFVPPIRYCTDNAAMIAYAGWCRLERGEVDEPGLAATASLPL